LNVRLTNTAKLQASYRVIQYPHHFCPAWKRKSGLGKLWATGILVCFKYEPHFATRAGA